MTISNETPTASPPQRSRILFAQPDEQSCLFQLPGAGWRSSFLLFFSVKWIALFVSCLVVVGVWQAGPLLYGYIAGLIVGCVLLGLWIKGCFEQTLVFLDRNRIVVKRNLFGWSRLREITLDTASRAELVEDQSRNESPVYGVEIRGSDGAAKFGAYLSEDELDWLVDTINGFLEVDPAPVNSQQESLREKILSEPIPLCVRVEEETPNSLRLCLPTAATVGAKAGGIIFGMTLAMIPLVVGVEFKWWWPYYVVPASFCLLLAILVIRGQTTIELTSAQLRHISQIGPWRYTQSIPTADIIEFAAVLNLGREWNQREKLHDLNETFHNCVAVLSSTKKHLFLWMAKQHATTYAAEMLQQKLNQIRKHVMS